MNYFLLNLLKILSLLRAPYKIILFLSHLIERADNLTVIWNVQSPQTHNTQESLRFLSVSRWGHSCYFINHLHWNLMMSILKTESLVQVL